MNSSTSSDEELMGLNNTWLQNHTSDSEGGEMYTPTISIVLYSLFLFTFIVVPLCIKMINYGSSRTIRTTITENAESWDIEGSKADIHLMRQLTVNSMILSETNYIPAEGSLLYAMESKDSRSYNSVNNGDEDTNVLTTRSQKSIKLVKCIPECSICLESYTFGDSIILSSSLDCCHAFHTSCLYEWIRRQKSTDWKCPLCRQMFLLPSVNSQECTL